MLGILKIADNNSNGKIQVYIQISSGGNYLLCSVMSLPSIIVH